MIRDKKKGIFLRYNVNDHFLDKMTYESAWLMGLLAADGCIIDGKRICIAQSHSAGKQLIKYVKNLLDFAGNIRHDMNVDNYFLQVTSPLLVKQLNKYGIVSRKSTILKFPKMPEKFIKSFIRGYFDGDGSVGIYNNGKGSRNLIASFVGTEQFIFECRKYIPIKANPLKIKRCQNLYELRWNGKKAIEFCNWLFSSSELFSYYKKKKFNDYMNKRNDKFTKYENVHKKVIDLYEQGMIRWQIALKVKNFIAPRTVYKWIDLYESNF